MDPTAPKAIKAEYSDECDDCTQPIERGDDCVYHPLTCRLVCYSCAGRGIIRDAEERARERVYAVQR